jgi:hypothetical protein
LREKVRSPRGVVAHELRYGRNADRADFRLVLSEGRGICSTKHALLAAVAFEQGSSIERRHRQSSREVPEVLGLGVFRRRDGQDENPVVVFVVELARVNVAHRADSGHFSRSGDSTNALRARSSSRPRSFNNRSRKATSFAEGPLRPPQSAILSAVLRSDAR